MGLGSDLGLFGRSVTVAPQLGRSGFWTAEVIIAPAPSMAEVPREDRVGFWASLPSIRSGTMADSASPCPAHAAGLAPEWAVYYLSRPRGPFALWDSLNILGSCPDHIIIVDVQLSSPCWACSATAVSLRFPRLARIYYVALRQSHHTCT